MKRLVFTLLLLIIRSSLIAQVLDKLSLFNTDYDKAFIKKHHIQQIIIHSTIGGQKSSVFLFDFDKNGLLEKESISDSLNRKINDYLFKYNEYGDLIERNNNNYEFGKSYSESFTKTYEGGLLVCNRWSLMPYTLKYTYYPDGRLKQSVSSMGEDSLNSAKSFKIYNYDSFGVLQSIEEAIESQSGNLNVIEKTIISRDSKGRIIAINKLNGFQSVIAYDMKGFIKTIRLKMTEDFGNIEVLDDYEFVFWK